MQDPTRRAVGLGLAALVAGAGGSRARADDADRLRAIEAGTGGRLGVAIRDGESGRLLLGYREGERFPLCSTFKVLAVAAILARIDRNGDSLDRSLPFTAADLDSYAPVTRPLVGAGAIPLGEACAAALVWSDNTAANLLLRELGGPDRLTAWLRASGDATSRLDRWEPDLNAAIPGDPRDTTTPAAMAATLRALLLGTVLAPASRDRLEAWMVVARTGMRRLRAGLPPDWTVGDKTGSGENGTTNVVAILRPPGRAPLLAALYLTGATAPPEAREAAHAEVGRLIAASIHGRT